jgi:hypothetical protein
MMVEPETVPFLNCQSMPETEAGCDRSIPSRGAQEPSPKAWAAARTPNPPLSSQGNAIVGETFNANHTPTFSFPLNSLVLVGATTTGSTRESNMSWVPPSVTPATADKVAYSVALTPFKATMNHFDTTFVSPESSGLTATECPGSKGLRSPQDALQNSAAQADRNGVDEETFSEVYQLVVSKQLQFDDGICAYDDAMLERMSSVCIEHSTMLTLEASTLRQMEDIDKILDQVEYGISAQVSIET